MNPINLCMFLYISSIWFSSHLRASASPETIPPTTREWSLRFQCRANKTGLQANCSTKSNQLAHKQTVYCGPDDEDVCSRGPADWMWKYFTELQPEYQVLIREKSMDERLANIIYTTVTTTGFDVRFNKIDAKDGVETNRAFWKLVKGPQVNETRCGRELKQMLGLVDSLGDRLMQERSLELVDDDEHPFGALDEAHVRLARVLDSYGRYQSGFLSGRFQSFGSYDQCINTQLKLSQDQARDRHLLTKMRYCWVQLNLTPSLSRELKTRQRFAHEFNSGSQISLGICLPESCHSKSLAKHKQTIQKLVDTQFKLPSSIYRRESLTVSSLECVVDDKSPMGIQTGGKILLGVLTLWLLLVVYATTHQRSHPRPGSALDGSFEANASSSSSWTDCLSLTSAWSEFVEARGGRPERSDMHISLDVLNPFKVITCLSVVLGHGLVTRYTISNTVLRDHKLLETSSLMSTYLIGPMIMDTYFVLSGLLITYIALVKTVKQRQEKDPIGPVVVVVDYVGNCTRFIANRFIRLLPLFYLAFAFKKGVLVHLGSGPMWNYGFNHKSNGQCQHETWLRPLMVTSYAHEHFARKCLPQTYTVSCDLMFAIFIAPLVFLINKWPRTIIIVCLIFSLASNWLGLAAFNALDGRLVWNFADLRSYGIFQIYSSPIGYIYAIPDYRLGSVLSGVICGYFLFKYQQDMKRQAVGGQQTSVVVATWPDWVIKSLTWFAVIYSMMILMFCALKEVLRPILGASMRSFNGHYLFTVRMIWCMAMAILAFRLTTSWHQLAQIQWTKAKPWKILVKLNYAILLIHFDLLLLDWQIQTVETQLSLYNLIKTFVFCFVCSSALGVLVHLTVEHPIVKLTKRYFG